MNPAIDVNMEMLTIIDEESGQHFMCQMSGEEVERARNDRQFAAAVLKHIKATKVKAFQTGCSNERIAEATISEKSDSDNKENNEENNNKSSDQHIWTKQETLVLLDIYTSREEQFHNGKITVKKSWENVAKEMKEMGHNLSGQKCSIKFQAMKRTYKSIKDQNNKSGNHATKWEYFYRMDEIFNKKPWAQPLAVAGTSCNSETNNTEETSKESTKKRKLTTETYLESILHEKRLKREEASRRHEEKMMQLESLKTVLDKLIEK